MEVPENLEGPDDWTYTVEIEAASEGAPTIDTMSGTVTNQNPTITFAGFEFVKPGTYQYTVREKSDEGANPGITDGTTEYTVFVNVEDNKNGTLTATAKYEDETGEEKTIDSDNPVVFTNTYSVEPAKDHFEVAKDLKGTPLRAGAFEFELKPIDGAPMPEGIEPGKSAFATNDTPDEQGKGKVIFDDITFEEPGTYSYTITEVNAGRKGYGYDANVVTVTVTVTDNRKGELETDVSYDGETEFKNTYTAVGEFTPTAKKKLNGRTLEEGQFTFELFEVVDGEEKLIETTTNEASGAVQFSTIKYDQDIFDEAADDQNSDDQNSDEQSESGENTEPKPVAAEPDAAGEAEADALAAEDDATETGDAVAAAETDDVVSSEDVPEATDAADATEVEAQAEESDDAFSFAEAAGLVGFNRFFSPKIAFAEEATVERSKTYTYIIREVNDGKPGYTYDDHQLVYTVTVTDRDEGKLDVDVKSEGSETFINTYEASGEVAFSGIKEVTGTELRDGQFSFKLKDANNNVLQIKKNAGDGAFAFDALTYNEGDAGKTFKYQIVEVNDGQTGYTYDSHVCSVEVKVTDNGDGTLTCTATLSDGEVAKFNNPYEPLPTSARFTAKKTLKGRTLKAGEFSFELSDANGKVVATAQNTAGGNVDFGYITFDEPGTYTFTAREVKGSLKNVTYDKSVKTYTVTVTDEGGQLVAKVSCDDKSATFKNTYKPNKPDKPKKPKVPTKRILPRTGDPAAAGNVMAYAAAGMASLLTGIKLHRRKRK